MIKIRELDERCPWPDELEPVGYGDHNVETFEEWRERNSILLQHLPNELVEQWVHRHWKNSVAKFIPLEGLLWREELWPPSDFITKVGTVRGNEPLDPEHDYKVFSGKVGGEKSQTAKTLDAGHWDYAPIVLETPEGFIDRVGDHIKTKYFLVEGHSRRRYLNALLRRNVQLGKQRVFVLHNL